MARALPDHSPDTLTKYARKVFDNSARAFREHSTEGAKMVLDCACTALSLADQLGCGFPRADFVAAADAVNQALAQLNDLVTRRGKPEVRLA